MTAYTDGPNTHKYRDANFITSWTLIDLYDVEGTRHVFHVPTAIVEQIETVADARRLMFLDPDPRVPDDSTPPRLPPPDDGNPGTTIALVVLAAIVLLAVVGWWVAVPR